MNAITSEKNKLGFVGVGYMGRPIAQRLLESGFRLSAYDRHRTKAEELTRYGGIVAESLAELSSSFSNGARGYFAIVESRNAAQSAASLAGGCYGHTFDISREINKLRDTARAIA